MGRSAGLNTKGPDIRRPRFPLFSWESIYLLPEPWTKGLWPREESLSPFNFDSNIEELQEERLIANGVVFSAACTIPGELVRDPRLEYNSISGLEVPVSDGKILSLLIIERRNPRAGNKEGQQKGGESLGDGHRSVSLFPGELG